MKNRIILLLVGIFVSLLAIQAQVNETQRLISDDIEAEDYFGNGVAVSGNYAIIGACYDDENGVNSGSAYIFFNNAGTWEQHQKLTASDGQTNDFFALTVAIYGNYAFATSLGANSYAGKVYVFQNNAGTWTETAILTASDAESSDLFGYSMSIDGDYAIIGAYGNDDGGSQSGSAYIFNNNAGVWTEILKLTAFDGNENDFFGISVSIDGDYAIVGADGSANNSGANSGTAYIFHNNSGNWVQTQKIEAADAVVGDYFGTSVSISEDLAAIGAGSKSDNGTWSGAAYVFHNNSGTWEQNTKLIASDAASKKHFGSSIFISGDTLIVGSEGNLSFSPFVNGSAYVFKNNLGNWEEEAIIQASDIAIKDQFACAIDFSNNFAFIGSPRSDTDYVDAGAVYVFEVIFTSIITQPVSQEDIIFGEDVVFSVEAEGINLTYQWRKDDVNLTNGGNISGAITTELSINSVSNADEGAYSCIVTGDYGEVTSEDAMLSVLSLPVITTDPTDATICEGENTSFIITAADADSYQWQVNMGSDYSDISEGGVYSNVTTATLNITTATSDMNGYLYRCVATNIVGSINSEAALLTVYITTEITTQPVSQLDIIVGTDVIFSIEAEGSNLNYQWRKGEVNLTDGGNISGSSTNELSISSVSYYDAGTYDCIVMGSCGEVTSEDAMLSVLSPPIVTTDPEDATICEGENTSFTITADGADSYQWQVNMGSDYSDISEGGVYSNVTTATLNITTAIFDMNGYLFRCVAANTNGSTNSEAALLTVYNITEITTQPVSQVDIIVGTDIIFLVEAEGASLNYQWRKHEVNLTDGGNISGATTNELSISPVTYDDAGTYDCIVTGSCGEVTSEDALLSILTGTNEDSIQEFSIYPNPTNGKIHFEISNSSVQNISIYNITGKLISKKIEIQQNETIDLSKFVSGIYFIRIQTEKEIFKTKIIKR